MALGLPEQKKPNEDHSSQGIVGKVNQTASALKGGIKIPGLPGLPKFSKRGLAKSLVKKGFKKVAVSFFLSPPGLAVIIVVVLLFLTFVTVMAAGCTIVNNPAGDIFGVNYCKSEGPAPTPTPTPGPEQPTSIVFQGGEAYLTTGDGCRVNCPAVNKGDTATIKVEIFLNTNDFNRNINNVRAVMQINTIFFSNIEATGNPEIVSIPTLSNYYLYKWKLLNPKTGQNHYTFTVTGKVQSDSGETNVVLTMIGVTIVDNNLGDLYAGATSPPTNNACNKYGGIMSSIKTDFPKLSATNYGDPVCSYTAAKFRKVIEATETNRENWDFWNDIADCESGSANGYTPNSKGGSWGKFQMRRSFPNPLKPWTQADDRGDVTWQKQIVNAISYNDSLNSQNNNFDYWGTAMCLCYYDKYKNGSYCKDIIKNKSVRAPNSGKCSICTASKGKN